MKLAIKVFVLCFLLLLILAACAIAPIFIGKQQIGGGPDLGAWSRTIIDGFTSVNIVDIGNGKSVLIDAGGDVQGTKILEALHYKKRTPNDIVAIFVTHAHPDHDAALAVFREAEVFAMKDEVGVAAGTEPYGSPVSFLVGRYNPHPFKIKHPLQDGEKVMVGSQELTAFAMPGHTPGSGAYFFGGILYLGDAAGVTSDGRLTGPIWLGSSDVRQGTDSLVRLAKLLEPRAREVKFIVTSHYGNVAGLKPLLDLVPKP